MKFSFFFNVIFFDNLLANLHDKEFGKYTKSLKLWSLYVDLEESFGTVINVKVDN